LSEARSEAQSGALPGAFLVISATVYIIALDN